MSGSYYLPGSHNVICDRTGKKLKAHEVRTEWNGLRVDRRVYEDRHPLDFLRSRPDDQTVQDALPGATAQFITGQVSADSLTGTTAPDDGGTIWDVDDNGFPGTVWDAEWD